MSLDDKPEIEWDGVLVGQDEKYFHWIIPQIYNWRLVTVPKRNESTYHRWWCYEGRSVYAAAIAVYAAMIWNGEGDPLAWSKNGQTQQWRDKPDALNDLAKIPPMEADRLALMNERVDELMSLAPSFIRT